MLIENMTVFKSSSHFMIVKQLLLLCCHVWFVSPMLCQIWLTSVGVMFFLVPARAPKAPGGSLTRSSAPLGAGLPVLQASSDSLCTPTCSHVSCCVSPSLTDLISWLDPDVVITGGQLWVLSPKLPCSPLWGAAGWGPGWWAHCSTFFPSWAAGPHCALIS